MPHLRQVRLAGAIRPNRRIHLPQLRELFLRLRDRLGEHGALIEQLALGTSLRELGLDSLDIVELIMVLEEEHQLTIPEHAAEQIKTLADAIRYIAEAIRRRKEQP